MLKVQLYFDALYEQISLALRRTINSGNKNDNMEIGSNISIIRRIECEKALAEKTKIKKRLKTLISMIRKLYEDNVSDVLEEEKHQELLLKYQQEQRTLQERLIIIDSELNSSKDFEKNMDDLKDRFAAFVNFTEWVVKCLIS